MVLVAACLGLRASEIVGLQLGDFNWEDLTVLIRRGGVNGTAGDTKTEASRKALPIDPRLAAPLAELWKRSLLKGPQDWVFAKPRWPTPRTTKHPPAPSETGSVAGWNWEDWLAHLSPLCRVPDYAELSLSKARISSADLQLTISRFSMMRHSPGCFTGS